MTTFWKAALGVCGLGAIGAFVFFSLYKQWLSLPIFSQMTSGQTFIIMLVFLSLVFLALVVMLATYYSTTHHGAQQTRLPATPAILPNGTPFPPEQREFFIDVWRSLVSLDRAGQELWDRVSDETLNGFAEKRREAETCIRDHALFFSEHDYQALQDLMRAADFYLGGKVNLSSIRDRTVYSDRITKMAVPGENDRFVDEEVKRQVQQNKRWLTRYRNLLDEVRSHLHAVVAAPRI